MSNTLFDTISTAKWYDRLDHIRGGILPLRLLCLNNPFCELMELGKIETRMNETKVRGLVMFLSCEKPFDLKKMLEIAGERQTDRILSIISPDKYRNNFCLSIGNLVDCRKMKPEDEDACFVEYSEKRFCWIFQDVKPIVPIYKKGHQGWRVLNNEKNIKLNTDLLSKIELR